MIINLYKCKLYVYIDNIKNIKNRLRKASFITNIILYPSMKIGIIGNGFVGKATRMFAKLPDTELLPHGTQEDIQGEGEGECEVAGNVDYISDYHNPSAFYPFKAKNREKDQTLNDSANIEVLVYDIRPEACIPIGITLEELDNKCDILFFCLPTPLYHDGSCYTKILEDSISKCENPFKVIRSTVPVGFSKSQNCYYMPEFLTEANWENDFKTNEKWFIGIPDYCMNTNNDRNGIKQQQLRLRHIQFKNRIHELITKSHKNRSIDNTEIVFCKTNDAEMLKITKNCFLAAKVSIMNEIYDFCSATGTDYHKVIEMARSDIRMGTSHFSVPGPDGHRGFGGTCFPKDTHSIYSQMNKSGVDSIVFPAILSRNDTVDRSEREWSRDVWRTTVPLPNGSNVILVFDDGSFTCDSDSSNSINQYLTSLCIDKLQNNHYVIIVTSQRDFKDKLSNSYLRNNNNNNNFIVKIQDIAKPIFIPRVDEIYYAGYKCNSTSNSDSRVIDELSSITRVIELWKQHTNSCLYVTKPNNYGCFSKNETINYTRVFEDINKDMNHNSRIIVLF